MHSLATTIIDAFSMFLLIQHFFVGGVLGFTYTSQIPTINSKYNPTSTRSSIPKHHHHHRHHRHRHHHKELYVNNRNNNSNNFDYEMDDLYYNGTSQPQQQSDVNSDILKNKIIPQIEQEIIASTNAKLDVKKVKDALTNINTQSSPDDLYSTTTDATSSPNTQPSQWNIALASGIVLGLFTFFSFHTFLLSGIVFMITTFMASRDPLNETENNISGPLFRIIGRGTLQSIEKSKPKVKAVARAVISTEDEYAQLKERMVELERENDELKLWIERRKFIDENGQFYSLDTLKNMARTRGIQIGGTKAQVMMRLIEAGSITIV